MPESDDIAMEPAAPEPTGSDAGAPGPHETPRKRSPGRPVWPIRLLLALVASAFTVSTVFIFAPLELVAANTQSLTFGLFDVSDLIIESGVVLALAVAFAVSALRGTAFDIVLCVLVATGLGCFLQALLLNPAQPSLDGGGPPLADDGWSGVVDTLVWVAVFLAILILNARSRRAARIVLPILCALLLAVQIVSLGTVAEGERVEENGLYDPVIMSTEGLNEVGAEGDVTVFVLDTFDNGHLDSLLESDPAALDEFTGFTRFRNSSGSMIPTRYGLTFLLTDAMPEPGDDYDDYLESRYADSPFLGDIVDAGYEVAVFSDTADTGAVEPYAANIYPIHHRDFDEGRLRGALQTMALFREAPSLLKPLFAYDMDDFTIGPTETYTVDNVNYYRNIHENGLEVSETAPKTFRFIHLSGMHFPFTMDEHGDYVEVTGPLQTGTAVIDYVEAYLRELKRLGLYDQSTVVITADHGYWSGGVGLMERESSPILLVKPAETPEEASRPLEVSDVPTGHVDYAATVIDAVGGDASAYGPTVFEVPEGPRDRYYWWVTHDGRRDYELIQYVIQGDVTNFDDWHLTGNVIVIQPGGLTDPAVMNPDGVGAGLIAPIPADVESTGTG